MLQNAFSILTIGADTAENELSKVCPLPSRPRPGSRPSLPQVLMGGDLTEVLLLQTLAAREPQTLDGVRQTLQGSFWAVSKPKFASKR